MSISIDLLNPIQEITQQGFLALSKEINKSFSSNLPKVLTHIKTAIYQALLEQPEILELSNYTPGGLASQLGLYPGQGEAAAMEIINTISSDVTYKFTPFNSKFSGGVEFYIAHNSIEKLLSLPIGHVVYGKGDLHWLQWMLEMGDTILISSYSYNPRSGLGRSGGGNMVYGGSFRIPPEFSGTPDSNFISRAFYSQDFQNKILNVIERII
jgi:hypothetical protein